MGVLKWYLWYIKHILETYCAYIDGMYIVLVALQSLGISFNSVILNFDLKVDLWLVVCKSSLLCHFNAFVYTCVS
jgi:hypothetical protein